MTSNKIIKTRCFFTDAADLDEIKNTLLKQNGIESVSIARNKLTVNYDLRLNNYQQIKDYLSYITTLRKENLLDELRSAFISFCERNEIDHTNKPTGWHYYIQNVYLSLHEEQHS